MEKLGYYIKTLQDEGLDELHYELKLMIKDLRNIKSDEILDGNWAESMIKEMHDVQYVIDETMEANWDPIPANDDQYFSFYLINSEDANACYRCARKIIKIIDNWTLKTETDAEMKKLKSSGLFCR